MQHAIPRLLGKWGLVLTLVLTAAPAAEGRAVSAEPTPNNTAAGAVDAATRHHHPDVVQPPTRIVTVAATDRFDWRDAGIGAVGTLGAALVVGGSALVLKHKQLTDSGISELKGSK